MTGVPSIDIVVASHRGAVRDHNEDSVGIAGWVMASQTARSFRMTVPVDQPIDFAVADGMGGHRGGALASRVGLTAFFVAASDTPAGGSLAHAITAASDAVHERSAADPTVAGMGTTIVGVRVFPDGAATVFNVGDSRAYRIVDGYLGQLSVDDRPAQHTPQNAGIVTQVLGGDRRTVLEPHLLALHLDPGDRVLLCSDGLSDYVDDAHITHALTLDAALCANALMSAAFEAGAPDNVTVMVLDVREPSPPNGAVPDTTER